MIRYLLGVLILMFLFSCDNNYVQTDNNASTSIKNINSDEIIKLNRSLDSLKLQNLKYAQELQNYKDSVFFYKKGIKYEDYISNRKIHKIKYYISICEKNSSQKKFFYGWVKRTVTDQ